MPKKKITNFNEKFDFKLLFLTARKVLILNLLLLILSIVLAYTYLRYTPNLYEATSTIKLGSENNVNKVLNLNSPNDQNNNNQIAGAIELMRSKVIVER